MGSCCSSYSCAARWERPATHYPIAITLDVTSPDRCPPGVRPRRRRAQLRRTLSWRKFFARLSDLARGCGWGGIRGGGPDINTLHANKDERHKKKHLDISCYLVKLSKERKFSTKRTASTDPVTGRLGVAINDGVPSAKFRPIRAAVLPTAARHGGSGLRLRRQNRQLE